MSEDPTAAYGAPAPSDPATDVCPNGHVLSLDQVVIRNGHKVCPVCEQQATAWATSGPPRPPLYWSRQALRVPLMVVAAAFMVEAISSAFGISTAAAYVSHQLPGSTAQLLSAIFDTLGEVGVAVGAAWIAYLCGQEADPGAPPARPGP